MGACHASVDHDQEGAAQAAVEETSTNRAEGGDNIIDFWGKILDVC